MSGYVKIDQVLLFKDSRSSSELGPPMWAAMMEVEAFYKQGGLDVDFYRTYLSEHVPDSISDTHGSFLGIGRFWDSMLEFFGQRKSDVQSKAGREKIAKHELESAWEGVKAKYSRTYNASKIINFVREFLGENGVNNFPVIVVDQELIPPRRWRYIIWRGNKCGQVISTVPIDPSYWRIRDENRISIVKHRTRVSFIQIVGGLLGLKHCANENCFMFRPVDSVIRLDHMVCLGDEHAGEAGAGSEIKEILGRGYEVIVKNPENVQPLIKDPEPVLETF